MINKNWLNFKIKFHKVVAMLISKNLLKSQNFPIFQRLNRPRPGQSIRVNLRQIYAPSKSDKQMQNHSHR